MKRFRKGAAVCILGALIGVQALTGCNSSQESSYSDTDETKKKKRSTSETTGEETTTAGEYIINTDVPHPDYPDETGGGQPDRPTVPDEPVSAADDTLEPDPEEPETPYVPRETEPEPENPYRAADSAQEAEAQMAMTLPGPDPDRDYWDEAARWNEDTIQLGVENARNYAEVGLREYRAYLRGDKENKFSGEIDARYRNNYLIPYLTALAAEQVLIAPNSVDSEWFTELNPNLPPVDGSYGNVYKKLAQDMLPYMLPDPDVMTRQLLAAFGGSEAVSQIDKRIDPKKIKEEYDNYDPYYYEESWSRDWEDFHRDFHYCYSGEGYGAGGLYFNYISPKYNERYLINSAVFGIDDKDNRTTIAPWSNASVLITQLKDIREREGSSEFYIQEIELQVRGDSMEEARAAMDRAFAIVQPYNTPEGRAQILSDARNDHIWAMVGQEDYSTGTMKPVYEMMPAFAGTERRFLFDELINYYFKKDYTPTWNPTPLYNLNTNSKNPYSPGYMTQLVDSYFNNTCDVHVDYLIEGGRTGSDEDSDYYEVLRIRYAGPTANAMNERKYTGSGWTWADTYGIYYPLTVPIYYNEAVLNGFFTPYEIPKKVREGEIGVAPDYTEDKPRYTEEAPRVSKNEQESKESQITRWFDSGLGSDRFPARTEDREKVDWYGWKGYTHNDDGTWTRELPADGYITKHTLTYDETGLLKYAYRSYKDGGYRMSEFMLDSDGNPTLSIEKFYDKNGSLENQMINHYGGNGSFVCSRDYYYKEKDASGNYRCYQTNHYNSAGNNTGWEKYYDNGGIQFRKTTTYWEEMGSSAINPVITRYARVDEIEYDRNGNIINTESKQFAAVKDRNDYSKRVKEFESYLAVGSIADVTDWP